MGGWPVAQSPILNTTITLKRLMQRGYVPMLDIYKRISPQLNEPLYTFLSGRQARTAWFTLSVAEVSSGVRGALRQLSLAEPSTRLGFRAFYSSSRLSCFI